MLAPFKTARPPAERLIRNGLIDRQVGASPVKFTIEVVRAIEGGGTEILRRISVEAISPRRPMLQTDQQLHAWRAREATGARLLNHRGEEIYAAKLS
jgi:hypothetical protein